MLCPFCFQADSSEEIVKRPEDSSVQKQIQSKVQTKAFLFFLKQAEAHQMSRYRITRDYWHILLLAQNSAIPVVQAFTMHVRSFLKTLC